LRPAGSQLWTLNSPGTGGEEPWSGSSFGSALAAARFGGAGPYGALVVVAGESDGVVLVINGSASGLTATRSRRWTTPDFRQPGPLYIDKALAAG
jgi:hypothetical protein